MDIFWGKVREGDKRGRELGYPTANMWLHKQFEEGVYVSVAKVPSSNVIASKAKQSSSEIAMPHDPRNDEEWLPALTFIGKAETFGKKDYKAETWILDFTGDLYRKFITVKLLKKLRGNKKFSSAESLVMQMKQDEREGREYFKNYYFPLKHSESALKGFIT